MKSIIIQELNEHLKTTRETIKTVVYPINESANICINSLKNNGKLLIFGNGGSAADAQHIAAEIVGRYINKRSGLPAIALTTDTSTLTSIGNDFGYENIFYRQIEALANQNDVAIGISTGGSSLNVINGLKIAKKIGCKTIGFSGKDGGEFNNLCDINIVAASYETPRVQEMHILFGHTICKLIDNAFADSNY
jgi:D-sedoheptulose 7-phosphate isomerase